MRYTLSNMDLTLRKGTLHLDMNELAHALDAGQHDTDVIRPKYSGRGMNGQTCLGIIGARAMATVIAHYSAVAAMDGDVLDYKWTEGITMDDMGRDVIFYWPRIEVDGELPRAASPADDDDYHDADLG